MDVSGTLLGVFPTKLNNSDDNLREARKPVQDNRLESSAVERCTNDAANCHTRAFDYTKSQFASISALMNLSLGLSAHVRPTGSDHEPARVRHY